jgi:Ca-activated chloride channel family protein
MGKPENQLEQRLDARLRDVPLPSGLLQRLKRLPLEDDQGLDEALRDVPLPVGLMSRLRDIARRARLRPQWLGRWAVAASLLVGVGLCFLAALWVFHLASPDDRELVLPDLLDEPGGAVTGDLVLEDPLSPGAELAEWLPETDWPEQYASVEVPLSPPEIDPMDGGASLPEPRPRWDQLDLLELADRDSADTFFGASAAQGQTVLASPDWFDRDDLERVPSLARRGVEPILVPGYDAPVFFKYRVHPHVSPDAHPKLRTSTVPLDVGTESFELTRRCVAEGTLPPPDEVHPEEFLAAIDCDFAHPPQEAVALYAAGSPSFFRGDELRLLQIGVQARDAPKRQGPGKHLVMAVDLSASMQWGGRLEMVRQALQRLVDRLGAGDRLTLVGFSQSAEVLFENAGKERSEQLRSEIRGLQKGRATNLGDGLRLASALARRWAAIEDRPTCMVLLTDGLTELDQASADRVARFVEEAAENGVPLEVVDLGQELESDGQLSDLAAVGKGHVYRATDADALCWALIEVLTGQSQVVAGDARLTITFNPVAVASYRLIGHGSKGIPARLEADLHAAEAATALYEIRLNRGGGNIVARAELTWHESGREEPKRIERVILREDFAPSLTDSALSLQAAAVAAEAAEVLRQSPFASTRSVDRVLQVAYLVDTRLQQRPSFARLIDLLERAEQAKPYRRGGR